MTPRERIGEVLKFAANTHCVPVEEITGTSTKPAFVKARWEAIRSLHDQGFSVTKIGRILGRDHSSISHALNIMSGGTRKRPYGRQG